jgi:hypothetical protein
MHNLIVEILQAMKVICMVIAIAILARAVIPIVESLVEELNPCCFYDGYENLQHSTT